MDIDILREELEGVDKLLGQQNPREGLRLIEDVQRKLGSSDIIEEKSILARTYYWEQLCWKHLSDIEKALIAHEKGIEIYRGLEDVVGQSNMLRDLGLTYEYIHQYDMAIKYLLQAISVLDKEKPTQEILSILGITKSKLGQIYLYKGDLENAKKHSLLGYQILLKTNHRFYQLTSLLPLIAIGIKTKNLGDQKRYIEKAENLLYELKDEHGYLNERRYVEIELFKAHMLVQEEDAENVFESFRNATRYILLTEKDERKRVIDATKINLIYEYLLNQGYKSQLEEFITILESENKDRIDWASEKIYKEFSARQ